MLSRDIDELSRAKLRTEREEPRFGLLKSESLEPILAQALRDIDEPNCTALKIDIAELIRA